MKRKMAGSPEGQNVQKNKKCFFRRTDQKIRRNIWDLRRLRHGSYSVVLTVIVLVAAVILNLVISEVPGQYTQFDFSEKQLSTIGDQTKEVLAGLDKDITLYYIVQDGAEDTYVSRLLEGYEDASAHIKVETKDPVLYPKFTAQYTEESLADNSIIAVSGEESRIIPYGDMYESEFNYNYYSYEPTGFDAEGQITSAIAALQSEDRPVVYTLTGHGEGSLNDSLLQSLAKENIQTESLNLVTSETVPEDADCILIMAPTKDIAQEEADKLLTYLQQGGRAVIFKDYSEEVFENLNSVLEYYGTTVGEGVILEGSSNYYVQIPYYLVPDINSTEVSADMTGGSEYVLLAAASPIEQLAEMRESVSVSSILSTSAASYAKLDAANMGTYEKENGDADGSFDIGVLITETVTAEETESEEMETGETAESRAVETEEIAATAEDSIAETEDGTVESEEVTETTEDSTVETEEVAEDSTVETEEAAENVAATLRSDETRLAVFTSSALLDASADQMVSGGNSKLFLNTLSWLCGQGTSVSVPVKSLSVDYLMMTSASSSFWSIVTIGIIPGGFLLFGLCIWLRRRKY